MAANRIVFVGAGKAAVTMIHHFLSDKSATVEAMVDLNDQAPGMVLARQLGVRTSRDMDAEIKRPEVNFIVEVTGNRKVRGRILELLRPDQELLSAEGARVMCEILDSSANRAVDVSNRLGSLTSQMDTALKSVETASHRIVRVLREIRILALNGNVEAARAGKAGAGFGVVVERMGSLVDEVEQAIAGIAEFSENSHNVLGAMQTTQNELRAAK